jgi:hypothetical protein
MSKLSDRVARLQRLLGAQRSTIEVTIQPWMLELAKRARQRASNEATTPHTPPKPRRAKGTESTR